MEEWLLAISVVKNAPGLKRIPDHTTLQFMAKTETTAQRDRSQIRSWDGAVDFDARDRKGEWLIFYPCLRRSV